jgi:ferritin-like protein
MKNRCEAPMSSVGYHEPVNELTDETRDMHRAITSLMEELEAVDWYNQRMDACKDAELREILKHNRDEEKEHAAMVLEWIRRKDALFSDQLKEYLFSEKSIVQKEHESKD